MTNSVQMIYFPNQETVEKAMQVDDPILLLIKHDLSKIILSNIDDAGEHIILLRLTNHKEAELDNFFRVIANNEGADWTFVCPASYKKIENRDYRIKEFYKDGIAVISKALKILHYDVSINIPKRYRRHLDILVE